jgi:hypothetical protein
MAQTFVDKTNNMKSKNKVIWVAARSERGFIADAALFETEHAAQVRERRWRKVANPDYDESAVFRCKIRFRLD